MGESTRLEATGGPGSLQSGTWCWLAWRPSFITPWGCETSAAAEAIAGDAYREAMAQAMMAAFDSDDGPDEAAPGEAAAEVQEYADTWRAWEARFQAPAYTAALHEWLVAHFFQIADRRPNREYARGRRSYRSLSTVRRRVAGIRLDDERIVKQCIAQAERCPFHYEALREVVQILGAAQQLPGALVGWVLADNQPQRRGRPRRHENHVRNALICAAVAALVDRGMQATRNDVSQVCSACDVVSKAFCLSYDGVLRIWKNKLRP